MRRAPHPGELVTDRINAFQARILGLGDLHDPNYDDTVVTVSLTDYLFPNSTSRVAGHCEYTFKAYSSAEYEASAKSMMPLIITASAAVFFILQALTFLLYDCFVQRRNTIVTGAASQSHAILSSLFPSQVRDKLFEERAKLQEEALKKENERKRQARKFRFSRNDIEAFLQDSTSFDISESIATASDIGYSSQPIVSHRVSKNRTFASRSSSDTIFFPFIAAAGQSFSIEYDFVR